MMRGVTLTHVQALTYKYAKKKEILLHISQLKKLMQFKKTYCFVKYRRCNIQSVHMLHDTLLYGITLYFSDQVSKSHPDIKSLFKGSCKNDRWGRNPVQSLQWRHNGHDGFSNHQPHHCLLNRLFGWKSKKTQKLRVTGLCAGNSPVRGIHPAQMASNAENVSIWWRHHDVNEGHIGMENSLLKTSQIACWPYEPC